MTRRIATRTARRTGGALGTPGRVGTALRTVSAVAAVLGGLALGGTDLAALGTTSAPTPAGAVHGEATLEASATSVAAGGTLTLRGGLFVPGEAHRLVLRGTLDDHELGTVTADADSTFTRELTIPADVRPGNYRLVAVAPDGDEVATLDLPVLEARRTQSGSGEATPAAEPTAPASSAEARADELSIERSRAGVEWGLIGLLIGLAGGLGAGLLRRA